MASLLVDSEMSQEDADFELLAASLRADVEDLTAFVEVLAVKLEDGLPGRTQIDRASLGFLSKRKRVKQITLDLGEDRYMLGFDGDDVHPRRARLVGGIVLKSEPLTLEQWIESLSRALAAEARVSESGRQALEQLLRAGD